MFKAILGYRESLRPAWTECLKEKEKKKEKNIGVLSNTPNRGFSAVEVLAKLDGVSFIPGNHMWKERTRESCSLSFTSTL